MNSDLVRLRHCLKEGDFRALFIDELGWDRHDAPLTVHVDGQSWTLRPCAHKRGMVAYLCPAPDGTQIPDYAIRRKIERQVARSVHEHLIVFMDATQASQVWQWVKREPGKPTACREHPFHRAQSGEALAQKLQAIAFTLDEEENLTLTDVTRRARRGFDVERITKRFYDRFKKEHAVFLNFIAGITDGADRAWYASVMLNRLMFVYFIQRKGFLDGDPEYLRHRLDHCRRQQGKDTFYSFYRYFLLRLFHEGLGGRARTAELEQLLGRIPYLNGGLFEPHSIEKDYAGIQIPDEAFERIFDYFDEYQWHLDERPLRNDKEINPDVLGYIFEKYINQKQMGAYYTKDDITGYISKSTIIPFLVDTARAQCNVAFENPQGPIVWDLLAADPDRYIYPAVRHGADQPFPAEIAAGIDPPTLHQPVGEGPVQTLALRQGWNQPAPPEFALPTETWREVVARRRRYEAIKSKLAAGEVRDINDLITLNLDIRQFAQDAIENGEGPDLLRAFWRAIEHVTILDPTCGSGAFLFAALNILEPLYEACLERMEAFIEDLDRSGEAHSPERFSDFRRVLARVAAHPNRRYFIFKSILLNNLFGVDIMEEAVEICKLRLFLKLAAQVEPNPQHDNLGIEPLPDIDFNIKAGNTLVGFATYEDAQRAITSTLDFDNAMEKISARAADLQQAFDVFRRHQVEDEGAVPMQDKQKLRRHLKALDDELNGYLAAEYDVKPLNKNIYAKWLKRHQPFHWFVEFYGIMSSGGFNVILGNPPYVVNTTMKVLYTIKEDLFKTFSCKNLYAYVYERSFQLANTQSSIGLIIQLTALSSDKMRPLQNLLIDRGLLVALSFPRRPKSVFNGVEMPVAILLSRPQPGGIMTSRINRFYADERSHALSLITLTKHAVRVHGYRLGKFGTDLQLDLFSKLNNSAISVESLIIALSKHRLYYQEACRYWAKACRGYPFFRRNGVQMHPPHGRTILLASREGCAFLVCLINSSLFYWFYSTFSDGEHINDILIRAFPIPNSWHTEDWLTLEDSLSRSLRHHSARKIISTVQGHTIEYDELSTSQSKEVIDEIDRKLAQHYGFTEEELDFIINYDIKYRTGRDADDKEA